MDIGKRHVASIFMVLDDAYSAAEIPSRTLEKTFPEITRITTGPATDTPVTPAATAANTNPSFDWNGIAFRNARHAAINIGWNRYIV